MIINRTFFYLYTLLTPCCLSCFGAEVIDDFQHQENKSARSTWVSKDKSPQVNRMREGIRLDLPFKGDRDRVYWQRDVSMNLSNFSSFRLDLSAENPASMRSLAIYLKSGPGWYIWNKPLTHSGRQSIQLPRSGFSSEGSPRGWNNIEAIRISPWKGQSINSHLVLHGLYAQKDSVLLVQGTRSIQGDSEKRAAEVVARRMSDWLGDAGISHNVVKDEELFFSDLTGISSVILSYHHVLPDDLRQMLVKYMSRGGQLIVFFSKDKKLAKAMGFTLGEYIRSDIPGRWATMTFPDDKSLHLPDHVVQESWNIRPPYPARSDARVLGQWVNAMGEKQPEPAWCISPQGAWMSHILLGGDQEGKQRLLLALIGRNDPKQWQQAAANLLAHTPEETGEADFAQAHEEILKKKNSADNPRQVEGLLEGARRLYNQAVEAYNRGEYAESADLSYQVRHLLVRSYGLVQPGKKKERRGVWDHHGTGWYPGDWNRTCRELRLAGFDHIYANLQWGGLAHYPSRVLPHSTTQRIMGDQAMSFRKACRKEGIEAHSWMVLWKLQNAPEEFVLRMKKEGRLQVDRSGEILPWLNPAHPENQKMMLAAIEEMITGYQMDGIHLDYVRYPNENSSFDSLSRKRFEASLGREVTSWPKDVGKGGLLASKYRDFRADQITAFVRKVRDLIDEISPSTTLSTAVFGKYPECRESVGQDWKRWVDEGIVDYVVPMSYTPYTERFREWTREQTRDHTQPSKVLAGIGVTASESDLTPTEVISQIQAARDLDAAGFVLFDLDPALREDILPYLTQGVMRR